MFLALLLLFTLIPLIEIAVLVKLGSWLGFWPAMALVVGTGIVGAALARWQGFRAVVRIQNQLEQGLLPTADITDGLLILVAGLMLITPGALTDLAGLALLLPPVRRILRIWVAEWARRRIRVERFDATAGTVHAGWRSGPNEIPRPSEIIDAEAWEARVRNTSEERD